MKQLSNKTRLCGWCNTMGDAELIDRKWTKAHGVVLTYRMNHPYGAHEWQESALPLDDPRNVSPRARKQKITAKKGRR